MKLKLQPRPAIKVRTITTMEGVYVNFEDMRGQLLQIGVQDRALTMLKIGRDKNDDPRRIMVAIIGDFIVACAGVKIQ